MGVEPMPTEPALEEREEHLSVPEVRRRAISGAAIDAMRGFGIRVLAFFGAAVLARQLAPADFGVVAVGQTFLTFGNLPVRRRHIRRGPHPANRGPYAHGPQGLSMAAAQSDDRPRCCVRARDDSVRADRRGHERDAAGASGGGVSSSEHDLARTSAQLPNTCGHGFLVGTLAFDAWAITTVSLGWGVWGLASAGVVRAVAGTIFLLVVFPPGRMIPWPSCTLARRLLGFGFRYQASNLLALVRDQAIRIRSVAAVGGVSDLGLYSMAYRIYQVPLLLFTSLWRISFPGMARLVAAREDMRSTVERVLGVVAVAAGVLLAPLAASARDLVWLYSAKQWTPPAAAYFRFA